MSISNNTNLLKSFFAGPEENANENMIVIEQVPEIQVENFEIPLENDMNFEELSNVNINLNGNGNNLCQEEENENYFIMFKSLKVESDEHFKEQTVVGDSKTSTSSAFTEDFDEQSDNKIIVDNDMPLEKDFIQKKRKRNTPAKNKEKKPKVKVTKGNKYCK